MTPLITLNGIGKESYITTTDLMAERLRIKHGVEATPVRYSETSWRNSRNSLKQVQDALDIISQLEEKFGKEPIDVLAHSHGCLITARIMEMCSYVRFRRVILFAPAMNRDWIFPTDAYQHMFVVYNNHDLATRVANLFPFQHDWGSAGSYGFKDVTPPGRIVNRDQFQDEDRVTWKSHSHYFKEEQLDKWAKRVVSWTSVPHCLSTTTGEK